jgi:hypothetical protein
MRRPLSVITLALLTAGCPSYDRYTPVADADGLVPADQFARYGGEQAQAIAIGRALGASWTGPGLAEAGRQVAAAVTYARSLPDVEQVSADSGAHLLTVTFRSGWRKAILPIEDGVPPDSTRGLPARR